MDFRPLPLLDGAHAQTLVGNLVSWARAPRAATWRLTLPDGDRLALEVTTPPGWRRDDPTVLLVHGLGGSHRSQYMVRLAAGLAAAGARAVRLNLRGCGSGEGLARRPYSGGGSDDLRAALEALRQDEPRSPRTLAGFSLGGNMALKLAGELEESGPDLVRRVIAVCPAVDLDVCCTRLERPEHRLYEWVYVRRLVHALRTREAAFPDLPRARLPEPLRLRAFDDVVTAPALGYTGVAEYYARASAAPHVRRARVPLRVLYTLDDPVIDPAIFDRLDLPSGTEVLRPDRGGHMGFVGRGALRWMDRVVLRWALRA